MAMVEMQRTKWRDRGEAGNETKKRQRIRENDSNPPLLMYL